MTEHIKLPEEQECPPPRRPSHAKVIENLDRWANSPELQPPTFVRRESRSAEYAEIRPANPSRPHRGNVGECTSRAKIHARPLIPAL
jgi:hypothetical protein